MQRSDQFVENMYGNMSVKRFSLFVTVITGTQIAVLLCCNLKIFIQEYRVKNVQNLFEDHRMKTRHNNKKKREKTAQDELHKCI